MRKDERLIKNGKEKKRGKVLNILFCFRLKQINIILILLCRYFCFNSVFDIFEVFLELKMKYFIYNLEKKGK